MMIRRKIFPRRAALSGVLDNLSTLVNVASQGVTASRYVLDDPAFSQIATRVVRLHQLQQTSARPGQPAPAEVKGIGLGRFVKPLDYYIKYLENPWMGYAAVAAVVGGIFYLGRMSKR